MADMILKSGYGVYTSLQQAVLNPRPNMYVRDEMGWAHIRETDVLLICKRTEELPIDQIEAQCLDFDPLLSPPIPERVMFKLPRKIDWSVIASFISWADYYAREHLTEVGATIYWDTSVKKYILHFPRQIVTKVNVMPQEQDEPEEYVKVMEIHSHHFWSANPSTQDDRVEQAPILYAIVGKVDQFFPQITVRTCLKRQHISVNPRDVIESPFETKTEPHAAVHVERR